MKKKMLLGRTSRAATVATLLAFTFVARAGEPAAVPVGSPTMGSAADRCSELRSVQWPALTVDEARLVPAGKVEPPPDTAPSPAPSTLVPEHCLFRGVIRRRTGAQGQHLGIG